jgi:prephenate dehydrogenase
MPKKRLLGVHTTGAWRELTDAQRDTHMRMLDVISAMRRNPHLSLKRAASEWNTTPETVRKYAGSALRHGVNGRFKVTASDRLYRPMQFYTPAGRITIGVTDSRTASKIAQHLNAIKTLVDTGNGEELRRFRGKTIRVQKVEYRFVTDPRVLRRLNDANELGFEDLYPRTGE